MGPASVHFTVLPNAQQSARDTTLTVANLPFSIRQDGRTPCSFSIAPEESRFDDEGGTAQVTVTAAAGCVWTATSNAAWITVTAGTGGQGAGSVTYAVEPNNAATARTGSLTIAGRTFTVDQRGEDIPQPANCLYSVAPVDFTPCMAGGRLTATITTQPNCTWTAAPAAPWLQVSSGRSGTGSGVVTIAFSNNYDAPRDGTVMVRWPTPTAGQNIRVAQAGCAYAVSTHAVSVAAVGGPGTFDVIQQSLPNSCGGPLQDGCVWTARTSAPWITITSSMPRSGDNPVSFVVAANAGAASRTGTITIMGEIVAVTQAGQ